MTGEIPDWLIIDATRYALGRCSYQVSTTCEWLCVYWREIPANARTVIQRDVEGAFGRDDASRANGERWAELGMACDRKSWEEVRKLWQT